MNPAFESELDAAVLNSSNWLSLLDTLPRLIILTIVVIAGLLVVALFVTALLNPIDDLADAHAPGASYAGAAQPHRWPERPGLVAPLAIVPMAAPGGPLTAVADGPVGSLNGELSPTDLIALTALRRRIQTGVVAEGPTARQRFEFARWLVEHDKLAE